MLQIVLCTGTSHVYIHRLYVCLAIGPAQTPCQRGHYLPNVSLPHLPRCVQHRLPLACHPHSSVHSHRTNTRLWHRDSMEVHLHQFSALCGVQFLHQLWHCLHLPTVHITGHSAGYPSEWRGGLAGTEGQPLHHLEVWSHWSDSRWFPADVTASARLALCTEDLLLLLLLHEKFTLCYWITRKQQSSCLECLFIYTVVDFFSLFYFSISHHSAIYSARKSVSVRCPIGKPVTWFNIRTSLLNMGYTVGKQGAT